MLFHFIISYTAKNCKSKREKVSLPALPRRSAPKNRPRRFICERIQKKPAKRLDKRGVCVYNKGCISAAAAFCVRGGSKIASATKESEVQKDAQNIPAEKAPQKNGARLQKENGDGQRQKGIEAQKSQRQTQAQLLSPCSERHKARKAEPFPAARGPQSRERMRPHFGAQRSRLWKNRKSRTF